VLQSEQVLCDVAHFPTNMEIWIRARAEVTHNVGRVADSPFLLRRWLYTATVNNP